MMLRWPQVQVVVQPSLQKRASNPPVPPVRSPEQMSCLPMKRMTAAAQGAALPLLTKAAPT